MMEMRYVLNKTVCNVSDCVARYIGRRQPVTCVGV
jgi:hypothetical protein